MAEPLNLYQGQQISIGGVIRYIATYEDISTLEPVDNNTGLGGVTREGYESMICHNFGYKSRPETSDWLTNSLPLENQKKPGYIVMPKYLQHVNLTIHEDMSLMDVLESLYLWGRGPIETGLLIDVNSSWLYPSEDEIRYCLQNKIYIKRTCVLTEKCHWAKTNILTRRLHNLCPHIDPDYFSNCITNFNEYATMIPVKDPESVFVCGIVNPDLLLSIIRSSEKEAAAIVNEQYGGYVSLRPDYDTAIEFYKIIGAKLERLSKIFKEHNARGILMMSYQEVLKTHKDNDIAINISIDKPDPETDRLTQLESVEDKRKYVEGVELNETNLGFLYRYFDQTSIPESLTKITQAKSGDTIITVTNPQLGKFLQRVYCIMESISTNRNYWLDDEAKWIFSKPFYASPNRFALFNPKIGLFLIAYPDMTYSLEEIPDAIRIYKYKYDEDVLLIQDEMGDRESPKVPNTELNPEDTVRFAQPQEVAS